MAIRIYEELVDDLDGSSTTVATNRFSIDGVDYQIDLSPANRDKLHAAFAPYIEAGRRLPTTRPTTRPTGRTTSRATGRTVGSGAATMGGQRLAVTPARVRAWWQVHEQRLRLPGHRPMGPIPQQVYDAFNDSLKDSLKDSPTHGPAPVTGDPVGAAPPVADANE